MRRLPFAIPFAVSIFFASAMQAQQNPCSNVIFKPSNTTDAKGASPNVACTIPQTYSDAGLYASDNPFAPIQKSTFGPLGPAGLTVTDFLTPLNSGIATSLALLPLVSPASAISFTFDPSLGMFVPATDAFGPIFSERASTIGRHRFSVGASYQYENFDSLDGIDLHSFPTVSLLSGDASFCQTNDPNHIGNCAGLRDFLEATNRIDLKVHLVNSFATFGVTSNFDVSVAVPVLNVRMDASADAHIIPNGGGFISFNSSPNFPCAESVQGQLCYHKVFSNANHSFGMGDITLRAKGTLKRWELAVLGAGVDVRIPTGDAINFLGSGAAGVRPFIVWSRRGRISPHANLGYQWNGSSILGADVTTGKKANLPGALLYSAGGEAAVSKRVTVTLDLVGERVFNTQINSVVQIMAPGSVCNSCNPVSAYPSFPVASVLSSSGSYSSDNAAVGIRFNPFGRLLLTANVQLKLDNGGLRATAIPLASATYTIR